MAHSTLITDYMGYGVAASRPASPNVPSGCLAFYYATDTLVESAWNGAAWVTLNGGTPTYATATATGTNQATALTVTADVVVCTTVAAGTGVITNPANGVRQKIYNRGANVLTVYPLLGSQIEALGVNVGGSIVVGGDSEFVGNFATQVYAG